MQSLSIPVAADTWLGLIAWAYLLTNAVRVFTYIPQILAVWKCRDGARSVSLLTWGSWVLSHVAATAYGVLVVKDALFLLITLINFAGCGLVAAIAARRRWQWKQARTPGWA
ncbi:MAG: hypothetical protein JSR41_16440 [Proteobacteria bacterium]|nr:hypothetical protein [Pseudomonadota bacterium]